MVSGHLLFCLFPSFVVLVDVVMDFSSIFVAVENVFL